MASNKDYLTHPQQVETPIRKAAILFAGGPAPAANAVISTAASSFLEQGIAVVGIKHGYSNLMKFSRERPLEKDKDYIEVTQKTLRRTRNAQGILIGTARDNPGKHINSPDDFNDAKASAPLRVVYDALCSLEVDALVSIGGDDTLKTANKFKMFVQRLPEGSRPIRVVHVPKTIDNDYHGIDFTFGYFTAVNVLGNEIRNLLYDAEAGRAYFIAETMGRSAGWLAYGAAIAGEASLVISVEDIKGDYAYEEEVTDSKTGKVELKQKMKLDKVIGRILRTVQAREKLGKEYGVIVLAEGLAEMLPEKELEGIPRDDHGHIAIAEVNLGRKFAKLLMKAYQEKLGRKLKVTGLQLGYESRCAQPTAFDVMLGAQLGVGAFRALVEEKLDGHMVSITGQLKLHYEPFDKLVDPTSLKTVVRYIEPDSDFHRLARFLEVYVREF